jgi:hypothetical protein
MISRSSGEATFADLRILPQAVLVPTEAQRTHALPIPGWSQHVLGIHESDRGAFEVEAVSDEQRRIQVVLLAHHHAFYQADTPEDGERRAFHEGVISADLAGQREFSWGQVFCRLDNKSKKDWLVLAYTLGPKVPLQTSAVLRHLHAHELEPHND